VSAQNYSMLLPGKKQGNVVVQRTATVELEVILYQSSIIKYKAVTDRDGHVTRTLVLDECGQPTRTTARAMNRGLEQLGWPGRVSQARGQLWYTSEFGPRFVLDRPLELSSLPAFPDNHSGFMQPGALAVQEVA
jgi:hypothetical protein